MSVDNDIDAAEGNATLDPIGTDFEDDLTRVGLTVKEAMAQEGGDDDERQAVIASMLQPLKADDVATSDAVVGAWLLILKASQSEFSD